MTLMIELDPGIEAGLALLAADQGMSLPQYVRRLLEDSVPGRGRTALSPAQRAELWRELAKGLPRTRPLSDEAISRESIYDTSG